LGVGLGGMLRKVEAASIRIDPGHLVLLLNLVDFGSWVVVFGHADILGVRAKHAWLVMSVHLRLNTPWLLIIS